MFKIIKILFKFLCWGAFALLIFIVATNVVVYKSSKKYIYDNVKEVKAEQTAVILGAAVYKGGKLSPFFQSRVDRAIELYNAKKVSKILASGDNSTVAHNEVDPVRNYLLAKGIPDSDIFLDHAGFDTYSTMYRARDIFRVSSVVIVTQAFHLPRAVFIARQLGLEAYGLSTDEEGIIAKKNYIREVFANEKAAFDLFFHIKPKYLGDTIPIK